MKCPSCGTDLAYTQRVVIRYDRVMIQTPLPLEMDESDIEHPLKYRETRTLHDTEWYCTACWSFLDTRVPDGQTLLNDYAY